MFCNYDRGSFVRRERHCDGCVLCRLRSLGRWRGAWVQLVDGRMSERSFGEAGEGVVDGIGGM